MKHFITILFFLQLLLPVQGQVNFKTVVPTQPVIAGESFQVQYIIEDGEKTMNIKPPVFSNFRVVAGPAIYMGSVSTVNGTRPLRNAVYTLEAGRPGRYIIPGATILVNGKLLRSNHAYVTVISKEEAVRKYNKENGSSSDYFLRPGEDPYEKIRQNLFVKVMVDKKNCYAGEAVQATFKLYSRVESRSDIIKNPGFYGFTVYDIVNLTDKQTATEKLNGQSYDVHTIRKVQLYPLQAGEFTVDAMRVRNKVEFSRSAVNKKTEQEIVEGILGKKEDAPVQEGTEVFETEISTEPVVIHVKPVPEKDRPAGFDGAAGQFSIAASLVKSDLAKNEGGFLEVTINGRGNFIQLSAPAVQWPAGIESFEPVIRDSFDKTTTPLSGSRTFRYPFVCAVPGNYQMNPVSFSFFDTGSNQFKTVSTAPVKWTVSNDDKVKQVVEAPVTPIAEKSERAARIAGAVIVLLVIVILGYWISGKKETELVSPASPAPDVPSYEKLLDPARALVTDETNRFYSTLHGIIWRFAAGQFGLAGSELNKKRLLEKMNEAGLSHGQAGRLINILEDCETGMFANSGLLYDKQKMLEEVKEVLENIRPGGS